MDSAADINDLLTDKILGKSYEEVSAYLKATLISIEQQSDPYKEITGMGAPLAMSARYTKAASTNVAHIHFKRRVVRIDVKNSAISNFELESAQVWNARTHGYMFDEGGFNTDALCHYKGQEVEVVNEKVGAKLYAFPNFVETPEEIEDKFTTCLIIGGKYDGSNTTTYYRVNVCPAASQQLLKANSIYTINITKVNSAGKSDKEDAYKSPIEVEYEINEWDDSFLGIYVFDKDGNGLAVSQRKVIFSEEGGGQSVQLEVFMLKGTTNPITGSWAVSELKGTDASTYFSAARNSVADDEKYLTVTALNENATLYDREATFDVTWGNIKIPISLTQLNPNSQSKIILQPDKLNFNRSADTQEICVNLHGYFGGIGRENITPTVLYPSDSDTKWLTLGQGATPDAPESGLFYFNVTASDNISTADRMAEIKFVLTHSDFIATAQAPVMQNSVVREIEIYLFEKSDNGYENRGLASEYFSQVKGLTPGQDASNHLHFNILVHDQFKYQMKTQSSMDWEISTWPGMSTNLQFSTSSGTGDANTSRTVEITVTSAADSGWDGGFYIEYSKGNEAADVQCTEFIVHQQGAVMKLGKHRIPGNHDVSIAEDDNYYYYGVFRLNGKLWLDRNLGATVGQDGIKGYFSNQTQADVVSDERARGLYFTQEQAEAACPPGFRLPENSSDEWIWVKNALILNTDGNASGGVPYKYVAYVSDGSNYKWFPPVSGNSTNAGASSLELTSGYYRVAGGKHYYSFSAARIFSDFVTNTATGKKTVFLFVAYRKIDRLLYRVVFSH